MLSVAVLGLAFFEAVVLLLTHGAFLDSSVAEITNGWGHPMQSDTT